MNSNPLISVLILNWNGEALLEECIYSVLHTVYSPFEVVVVDNNSTDRSLDVLTLFPDITVVRNRVNCGYAEGNNIGFQHCRGKYIVTLNNDMTVDPHWLLEPVKVLENNSDIGMVGCRQMSYQNRNTIDGLYHIIKKDLTFYPFGAQKEIDVHPAFLHSGYVLSINGGSSILRKQMIDEIGGFDTRHFAYYDEVDLCMRAFMRGWRAWYCSSAVVFHKGSLSFKKTGVYTYFLRERNRFWVLYKYFPLPMLLFHLPFFLLLEVRILRVMCVKLKRPDQYLKARKEGLMCTKLYKADRIANLSQLKSKKRLFNKLIKKGLILPAEAVEL